MLRHLGYACLCLSVDGSSPRRTILRNASPDRLRALIGLNLDNLTTVLRFNVTHQIRLFRISSDVIPFGSHPINQVPWWEEFADRLAALGEEIRRHGLRVSMHPGQYTVLSSPDPKVVAAAAGDLAYHARFLDALGLDGTHKIIVHGGGIYGDRPAAVRRWTQRWGSLPEDVRARLVVENDERLFGAEDVLELSRRTGTPVVFDVFHHRVYAGGDELLVPLLRRALQTWDPVRDGVPKIHYSTQAAGRRPGAHAEYVEPEEFRHFLQVAPVEVAFDCMLEAKAKDLALFRVRQALQLAAWGGRPALVACIGAEVANGPRSAEQRERRLPPSRSTRAGAGVARRSRFPDCRRVAAYQTESGCRCRRSGRWRDCGSLTA